MSSYAITEVFSTGTLSVGVGLFLADASAGSMVLTLPNTSGNAGNIVQVKRVDWVSSNTVTIIPDPTDGSNIDGTMTSFALSPGIDAFMFVDFNNMWQRTLSDLSSSFAFGDGSDGVVAITSNTTLARDMYYLQLDIGSGAVVNTNGFRIFVADRLTMTGSGTTIMNNGGNALDQHRRHSRWRIHSWQYDLVNWWWICGRCGRHGTARNRNSRIAHCR